MSAFFAAAYLGLGLTAVLTGLISLRVTTVDASVYTSGLVAAIVVAAIPVVLRTFGTAMTPLKVRLTLHQQEKEGHGTPKEQQRRAEQLEHRLQVDQHGEVPDRRQEDRELDREDEEERRHRH